MFHSENGNEKPIPTSQISTINRSDPITFEDEDQSPAILKKQILSVSIPQTSFDKNASLEAIRVKKEFEIQLQAKETMDEVAEFEKRVFGKTSKLPPLNLTPPTPEQLKILRSIEMPSPVKFFDVYKSPPRSCPISPHKQRIQSELASLPFSQKNSSRGTRSNSSIKASQTTSPHEKVRPAVWTLLDEPTMPSRGNICYKQEKYNKKPFYKLSLRDNSRGIRTVIPDLNQIHKQKIERYEKSVKTMIELDKKKQEKELRQRVQMNLTKMRDQREKTIKLMNDAGQNWTQSKLTTQQLQQIQNEKNIPKEIDPDDLEALRDLDRRDQEIRNAIKVKRSQFSSTENLD